MNPLFKRAKKSLWIFCPLGIAHTSKGELETMNHTKGQLKSILRFLSSPIMNQGTGIQRGGDMIKALALLSMVVGHTFKLLLDAAWIDWMLQWSWGLYGWQCAVGIHFTRDRAAYFGRLGLLAIVSQVPYLLLFPKGINPVGALLLGGLICSLIEEKNWWASIGLSMGAFYALGVSFGYCLWVVVAHALVKRDRWDMAIGSFAYFGSLYVLGFSGWMALTPVIILLFSGLRINVNRWVYYWFYPAHLMAIWGLKWAV